MEVRYGSAWVQLLDHAVSRAIGEAPTTHLQRGLHETDDVLVIADHIMGVDIEGVGSELLPTGHARHHGILAMERLGAELMPDDIIVESSERAAQWLLDFHEEPETRR